MPVKMPVVLFWDNETLEACRDPTTTPSINVPQLGLEHPDLVSEDLPLVRPVVV